MRQFGRAVMFGVILGIAWMVGWYQALHYNRTLELAKIQPCAVAPAGAASPAPEGVWDQVKRWGQDKLAGAQDYFSDCQSRVRDEESAANGKVRWGMVWVTLASPLMFVVSFYLVNASARRSSLAREAAQAGRMHRTALENEAATKARQQAMQDQHQAAKERIGREEFISKLGRVSEAIDALGMPDTSPGDAPILRQGIHSDLRELVKKYDASALRAMIAGDQVIQFKLRNTDDRLRRHGIESEDVAVMLALARG